MTDPPACLASLPVSSLSVWWPIVSSRVCMDVRLVVSYWQGRRAGVAGRGSGTPRLLPDVEPLDEIRVSLRVFALEVVEQAAPFADQHQQPAARMMILGVRLEM